jgi:hypothetical protein
MHRKCLDIATCEFAYNAASVREFSALSGGAVARHRAAVYGELRGAKKMRAATLAAVLLLASCAHTSAVQDVGNGMHSVTGTAAWGGYTGSHEENIEQANEFCAKSSQQAVIESFEDKPGVGPKGEHTSTMMFACGARPVLQYQ